MNVDSCGETRVIFSWFDNVEENPVWIDFNGEQWSVAVVATGIWSVVSDVEFAADVEFVGPEQLGPCQCAVSKLCDGRRWWVLSPVNVLVWTLSLRDKSGVTWTGVS